METDRSARAFASYMRKQRSITEDVEDRDPPTLYDEMYAGYPSHLKRFLPAAHLQVRGSPEFQGLEQQDPHSFRQVVAEAAFRMSKLSARDLGSVPEFAKIAQEKMGLSGAPPLLKEDVDLPGDHEEPDGDEGPVIIANVGTRGGVAFRWPVRIFAAEEEGFVMRIGPHTSIAPSRGAALRELASFGMDMGAALELLRKASLEGETTHTTPAYWPGEADPACP